MYVIRSYNREGKLLAEFHRATNVAVAYALNGGKALSFDLAVSDPKATRINLDRGNIIVGYSDDMETWSGFIVRRSWTPNVLSVTCYPASYKLTRRFTQPAKLDNRTGGEIFTYLMNEANRRMPCGLVLGSIFAGGKKVSLELAEDPVFDKMTELMDLTKYEYTITMVNPGLWSVDMSEKVGSDKTADVVVFAGIDTQDAPTYEEDDIDFANAITATGKDGSTSTSGSSGGGRSGPNGPSGDGTSSTSTKPHQEYVDWASVSIYGIMEDVIDLPDVTDGHTLLEGARKEVEKRKWPTRTTTFNLNRRRKLWGSFTDGDIICLQLPNYGFTGMAIPFRVLGREVNDDKGSMTVAGEVVTGEDAQLLTMFKNSHYGTGIDFIYPSPTP